MVKMRRLIMAKVLIPMAAALCSCCQQGAMGQDQPDFNSARVEPNQIEPSNQIENELDGSFTMLRGPVHEAFAEQFSATLSPAEVIHKEPPAPIDEQPPNFKPEGDNIEWISGYWGWDVESDDYVWVTGIWRNVPPHQQWIPGYWSQINDGWQWISGFWTATDAEELVYLPAPPETIDNGPSSPPPGADYFWIPGTWQYVQNQFVWQAGFWAQAQDNWVWVNNRYISTPSGCLYREGFWDYEVDSRGTVFCPMNFRAGYSQPFRPQYVVEVGPYWLANLFVTPGFNHYCFGNYYGYQGNRQIFPWVNYHQHSRNFDPLFSYYAYQSRHTSLIQQIARVERQLSNDPTLRTKATVAAQLQAASGLPIQQAQWALRAVPLNLLASPNKLDFDTPFQFAAFQQQLGNEGLPRINSVRQLAEQRRDLELPNSPDDKQRAIPRSASEPTNGNSEAGKVTIPGNVKRLSVRANAGEDGKGRLGLVDPNSPGPQSKKNNAVTNASSPKRNAEFPKQTEKAPEGKGNKNATSAPNTAQSSDPNLAKRSVFEHLNQGAQEKKSAGDEARALRDISRRKNQPTGGAGGVQGAEKQNTKDANTAKSAAGTTRPAIGKSPPQPRPNTKGPEANGPPKNANPNPPANKKDSQPAKAKGGNGKKEK